MLPFDWTTLKKPKLHEGRYYWNFVSPVISIDISESEKEQATEKGLQKIFSFFGKQRPPSMTVLVSDSLSLSEIYIDPRPVCNELKVLVSIKKDDLDSLDDIEYDIDNLLIFNTTTQELAEYIDELSKMMFRHSLYALLAREFLHIDDFIVDLDKKRKKIARIPEEMAARALLNDVRYNVSEEDSLQILFNDNRLFVGAILNGTPLKKGATAADDVSTSALLDQFSSTLLSQLEEIGPLAYNVNHSRTREVWRGFYRDHITYGEVSFKDIEPEDNFIKEQANNLFNSTNLPNFLQTRSDRIQREIERFKELPEQFLGNQCGPLDLTELAVGEDSDISRIKKIIKTGDDKEIEDLLIDNTFIKVNIYERNRNRLDYVGDIVFDTIPEIFPNGPSTIDEVYDNVLNYISFDLLIKKAMQCLLAQGEFPELWKLCIDIYLPFSLTLIDNLKIPDIFGFISDLIVKALLFILQQALFLLIDSIIDALEKCIRGKLIDTGITDLDDTFNNVDAAVTRLAQKVYDNFDNLQDAQLLVEDEFSDPRSLLEDLAVALTPQEFCQVMAGTASDEVYRIVLCLIETRYKQIAEKVDTIEKVKSAFVSLGSLVNLEKCDVDFDIPVPVSPDLCLSREQLEIRKELLQNKYQDISSEMLEEQLEAAEARRKNALEQLSNFLDPNALNDQVYGDSSRQDFAISLSPCSAENEPMRHMIELSTDSAIDPLATFFAQAVLGQTGLSAIFSDIFEQQYISEITSDNFAQQTSAGFSIGSPPYQVNYSADRGSQQQTVQFGNVQLTSTVPRAPIGAPPGSRINYFTNLSPDLDEQDYADAFEFFIQFISSKISESQVFAASEQQVRAQLQTIISPLTGYADLYENCWEGGTNVRDGINDSYFERDCETRDTTLYTQSVIAGLLRLYVRATMVEFLLKNSGLITQFTSKDLINTFIKDFIEIQLAPIISSIQKTEFINNVDQLVSDELNVVFDEFEKILEVFTNPNLKDDGKNAIHYFFDSIPIVSDDSVLATFNFTKPNFSRFYFISRTKVDQARNQMTISLDLKYAKGDSNNLTYVTLLTKERVIPNIALLLPNQIDEIVLELKEEMENSSQIETLLTYSIPTNDILSFIGMYNMIRIRNNIFDQLFIMNENMIINLENSDNFTYRNRRFERRNRLNQTERYRN